MFKVVDDVLCVENEGVFKPVLQIERYDAGGECLPLVPKVQGNEVLLTEAEEKVTTSLVAEDGSVLLKVPGGFQHSIVV
ncbi:MAG: hypothetical protein RLZZ234_253 [Candidatus Parcubacteria bacterium]|jgi:hypothetical protein